MIGYIYDDNGTLTSTVTGRLVDIAPMSISDEYSATYAFDLATSADYELLAYDNDDGYASTIYLTIYYTTNANGQYLLTRVSGYWVISDPKASVTSASLHYACTEYSAPRSQDVTRSVSNNFSYATGFSTYVYNTPVSTLAAELTLEYLIGTSRTWDFTLQNILF